MQAYISTVTVLMWARRGNAAFDAHVRTHIAYTAFIGDAHIPIRSGMVCSTEPDTQTVYGPLN
jgi:hypothetical protein